MDTVMDEVKVERRWVVSVGDYHYFTDMETACEIVKLIDDIQKKLVPVNARYVGYNLIYSVADDCTVPIKITYGEVYISTE